MYSDPRNANNDEAEKKAQQQAEQAEKLKKKQEEEERKRVENKKRELKRKIGSLNLDLNTVEAKIGVAKSALKVFEREARIEGAHNEKAEREITLMRRDLAQKKGAVRKLEKDIETKMAHEKHGSGENKKKIYEDKKRNFEKLENERSSIQHQMSRAENELRNVK
jgi:hypothetical protein